MEDGTDGPLARGASRAKSGEAEQAGPTAATATARVGGRREDTSTPDGTTAAGDNSSADSPANSDIKEEGGGAPESLVDGEEDSSDGRDLVAPPADEVKADDEEEEEDDEEDDVPLSQLKEYQERHSPRRSARVVKHKYNGDDDDEEEEEEEMDEQFSDDSEEYEEMDDNEDWTSSNKRRNSSSSNDAAASKKTDKYGNPFTSHQCLQCERCFSSSPSLDYHTSNNICKNGKDGTDAPCSGNGGDKGEVHLPDEVEEEDDKVSPKGKAGRGYDTSPPEVNAAVKRGDISAVDPVPRFNEKRQRCCTIKECNKMSRGTGSAFMCHSHHKDWVGSGCILPDVNSTAYKHFVKANGRKPTTVVDVKPPAPKSNVKSSPISRSRRSTGGRPSRPVRSTSADACYIDGCDMPKEEGMETCEEHSGLHPGKRRSRASSDNSNGSGGGKRKRRYTKKSKQWSCGWLRLAPEDDEEEEEVLPEVESEESDESENEGEESNESEVEAERTTGTRSTIRSKRGPNRLKKNLCRVEGCPKYLQAGRNGMCAAHFSAAKVYGVDAVLAEGMEVSAQTKLDHNARSARKKETNEKKAKGSPKESPRKVRAKRSEQDMEKPPTSAREPTSKRKKSEESTKSLSPARQLEKELGLPKYDDASHWSSCVVGSCGLGIQVPREYRMCRTHYRELVENETKGTQKKYAYYAALMRPPKSPTKSSPKKKMSNAKIKATPRKRKMSNDITEEDAVKMKRCITKEMPTVVDDRMAPDNTEETVAFVSAQVRDIWKSLPSDIDLNSLPPIPRSVFFGDIDQDSTPDSKPVSDENAEEGKAATKRDDIKPLLIDSINVNPKMNYNVIYLAVKARLAAKNYMAALSLCQKALLDWYDQAEKCARFHRSDPPNWTSLGPDIPSLEAVCDSLAGLWCVYAWLLQDLVTSSPSRSLVDADADADAEVSESKLSPPRPDPSTQSNDRKFLSGAVIPENLFGLSHDHIRWSDVLAALHVATNCHLAGRRAWPWLARARATVLAAEAIEKAKTTPSSATPDERGDQTRASDILLKSYGDAVSICREGISRVSVLSSAHLAKSRKLLVPTSIQGITLPFFGQDNARTLCIEINHMCDMKHRVEKVMEMENNNAPDTGAVMNGGTAYGAKYQDAANQTQEKNDQPAPPSATSAVRAVEWVCSGCAEHFSNRDAFLSHKKECPKQAPGGKGRRGLIDQEKHTANEIFNTFPVSCASIFSGADATDVLDYLVEVFPATKSDICRKMGRPAKVDAEGDAHDTTSSDHAGLLANSPVFEGQVGLRCIYCRDAEGSTGAVYPPTISDLPRAMWRLRVSHFERCNHLPDDCRARYEVLRNTVAPESISSKRYWNEAADGLRLQDVSKGIMWPSTTSDGGNAVEKAVVRFDGSAGAPN